MLSIGLYTKKKKKEDKKTDEVIKVSNKLEN